MSFDHSPEVNHKSLEKLLDGLDQGIESHVEWNQQIVRCVLLHISPGDDLLSQHAHESCRFGQWLASQHALLAGFDASLLQEIEAQHHLMHDAARSLCDGILKGQEARVADVTAFENGQNGMIRGLTTLRHELTGLAQQLDSLTGLPLRNGLDYIFRIRQHDAARQGETLYLAMVDVDHFKDVNDRWGHPVGDLALKHLAGLFTHGLRDSDVVVRFGGEEFLFLLLGHDAAGVTDRILRDVRHHGMALEDGSILKMTVTAGLTAVRADDELGDAVSRADHALLQGKQQGRDRYVMAA